MKVMEMIGGGGDDKVKCMRQWCERTVIGVALIAKPQSHLSPNPPAHYPKPYPHTRPFT